MSNQTFGAPPEQRNLPQNESKETHLLSPLYPRLNQNHASLNARISRAQVFDFSDSSYPKTAVYDISPFVPSCIHPTAELNGAGRDRQQRIRASRCHHN
jgi:hypothetical protein